MARWDVGGDIRGREGGDDECFCRNNIVCKTYAYENRTGSKGRTCHRKGERGSTCCARTLCGLKPKQLWLADRRQDNETSLVRRMFVRKMHRDVGGIN